VGSGSASEQTASWPRNSAFELYPGSIGAGHGTCWFDFLQGIAV